MHARTQSLLAAVAAIVGLLALLVLIDRSTSHVTADPGTAASTALASQAVTVDDDEFEDEDDIDEVREHLEMERAHLETQFAQFELVHRIAETARDEVTTAAFAVMHIEEMFEEPEELIDFLLDCRNETENDAIKRVINVKLAHIYAEADQPEKVRETMKKLIIGK